MSDISRLFSGLRSSANGLSAERTRIDIIAQNIANARTTRTPSGEPYRRQIVHFEPILKQHEDGRVRYEGVRASRIEPDLETPMERIFDPSHADAGPDGYVMYPNVNATMEMADMITALRAYESNINSQESFIHMAQTALRLLQ